MATADRIAREIRASCRRMQRRAAIVGAGVTGLVAGRELAWRGVEGGEHTLASVWRPLMLGKFGEDAERIPLAWLWSKFVLRRSKLGGKSATGELLGYPRGSFQAICRALADDLRARGGSI